MFEKYDAAGLTMYGQMTAGSWIYIGTQGIIQGTYESFAAAGRTHFGSDSLKGRWILTAGMGGMSGAQPLAATMNEAVILNVEVRPERIARKVKEGYCDRMTDRVDEAVEWVLAAKKNERPLSVGLVGNAGDIHPYLVGQNIIPDIVTDQTPAHSLYDYVPSGDLAELEQLKKTDPGQWAKRSLETIARHEQAILDMQDQGAVAFDYGNNLRAQAESAGVSVRKPDGSYKYPGFVPAYIRPLFCEGRGGSFRQHPGHRASRPSRARHVSRQSLPGSVDPAGKPKNPPSGPSRPGVLAGVRRTGRIRPEDERPDPERGSPGAGGNRP
jgi:urocanate hydratase